MGPSIRGLWSTIHLRLRPTAIGMNMDMNGSPNRLTALQKRKMLLKAAVFRGDPREFLG